MAGKSSLQGAFALLALLGLFLFARTGGAQEVLDGVAAVVNGDVITFSQVRELVGSREKSLRDTYKGEELVAKVKELRISALNDLIDRQLVIQEFKKNKLSIPEYIVEDQVQSIIRTEFGGDRNAFHRTLEAQGYTLARFKEIETEKIIVQAMRQKFVKVNTVVPPNEVEAEYNRHHEEFSTPEQVKLRMIILKKDTGDLDSKKKLAAEIRAKVKGGAEFDKVAQMYSEDNSQDTGGDWGWIDRHTLNEELSKAAFGLKPGQVSEVLEVGNNFYLLFVEARKNASVKPLGEVRTDIEKKLLQAERTKAQQKWIEGLRKKAFIKTF
jgi:parvulin-like peptidyl-prolyl isomerase